MNKLYYNDNVNRNKVHSERVLRSKFRIDIQCYVIIVISE